MGFVPCGRCPQAAEIIASTSTTKPKPRVMSEAITPTRISDLRSCPMRGPQNVATAAAATRTHASCVTGRRLSNRS